jgi:hypothetical protein
MSKRVNNQDACTMNKYGTRRKHEHLQYIYMSNINLNITHNKLYVFSKSYVIASIRTWRLT